MVVDSDLREVNYEKYCGICRVRDWHCCQPLP